MTAIDDERTVSQAPSVEPVRVQIDLETTHQQIDGFGVNINPVGHWRDGELRPVLDLLVDDYGARLFRLDPYGSMLWVDPDNAGGPHLLTEDRLAEAYRSDPFRDAWETARYLNRRGIEPLLNVSGIVPRWMCAADGSTLIDHEGYARLVTSMARWARVEEGIDFHLLGPFNETDLGPPEGPSVGPAALAQVSVLIADQLDALGLGDIGLVLADQGRYNLDYLEAIVRQEVVRDRLAVAGMHTYSDQDLSAVPAFLEAQGLGACRYWLTEYGDLDQTGAVEWQVAVNSVRRLLRGLNSGAQGAMVWDAYDNWHDHDQAWTIWGIIRSARHLYTPKKRYHAGKQVSRFVPPGSSRVSVTMTEPAIDVAAFRTPSGGVTVVMLNESTSRPIVLDASASTVAASCRVFVTDPDRDCEVTMQFSWETSVQFSLAANSITTVTTEA